MTFDSDQRPPLLEAVLEQFVAMKPASDISEPLLITDWIQEMQQLIRLEDPKRITRKLNKNKYIHSFIRELQLQEQVKIAQEEGLYDIIEDIITDLSITSKARAIHYISFDNRRHGQLQGNPFEYYSSQGEYGRNEFIQIFLSRFRTPVGLNVFENERSPMITQVHHMTKNKQVTQELYNNFILGQQVDKQSLYTRLEDFIGSVSI